MQDPFVWVRTCQPKSLEASKMVVLLTKAYRIEDDMAVFEHDTHLCSSINRRLGPSALRCFFYSVDHLLLSTLVQTRTLGAT